MGGDLKTGTFLYADASSGRHELGVKVFSFPGETRQEVAASPGRTYFFNAVVSERAKKLSTAQAAGGLVGLAIVAAMTSDDKNPGPVDRFGGCGPAARDRSNDSARCYRQPRGQSPGRCLLLFL